MAGKAKRDVKPTINDVARLSGVSKKTVSRVINRSPLLNQATREKVEAVIAELGYVPIRSSDTYLRGYSLEMLRDLELVPLIDAESQNGLFFDASIRRLFALIHAGHQGAAQARLTAGPAAPHPPAVPAWRIHPPSSRPISATIRLACSYWPSDSQRQRCARRRYRRRVFRVASASISASCRGLPRRL